MWHVKALLLFLLLLYALGLHDWGHGKFYGGEDYAGGALLAAIGALLLYLAFSR